MDISKWITLAGQLAPQVLAGTKLAPLAPFLTIGIQSAEQLVNAKGREKLAHAIELAKIGIAATNAQVGKTVIDPDITNDAIEKGIGAVIAVTNTVHSIQEGVK